MLNQEDEEQHQHPISSADTTSIMTYLDATNSSPCNTFKAKQFLEQTYLLEGIREDYLEKEIQKICAKQVFGEVIIEEESVYNFNISP